MRQRDCRGGQGTLRSACSGDGGGGGVLGARLGIQSPNRRGRTRRFRASWRAARKRGLPRSGRRESWTIRRQRRQSWEEQLGWSIDWESDAGKVHFWETRRVRGSPHTRGLALPPLPRHRVGQGSSVGSPAAAAPPVRPRGQGTSGLSSSGPREEDACLHSRERGRPRSCRKGAGMWREVRACGEVA